jgi:hypothetical protein
VPPSATSAAVPAPAPVGSLRFADPAVPVPLPLEASLDGSRLTSDGGLVWLGEAGAVLVPLCQQVVHLDGRLGLVQLEHVAQDGTKVLANASKHRAMSGARLQQAEERLSREIRAQFEAANVADAESRQRRRGRRVQARADGRCAARGPERGEQSPRAQSRDHPRLASPAPTRSGGGGATLGERLSPWPVSPCPCGLNSDLLALGELTKVAPGGPHAPAGRGDRGEGPLRLVVRDGPCRLS